MFWLAAAMIGFSSTTYSEFEEQRAFIRVVMNGTFGEGVRYSVEFSTRDLIDTQAPATGKSALRYCEEPALIMFIFTVAK